VDLAVNLFEAAAAFDYRMPEVFAGFDREQSCRPVEYPTPSRPQAWSSGAVLLALRTLLGLDADSGHLTVSGQPVAPVGAMRLSGIPVHRRRETAQI
jgi:glycogen debranching enzyme